MTDKLKFWRIIWAAFCLILCCGFLAAFGWTAYLSRQCIVSDIELAKVLNDPSWTNWDWVIYLGCCAPLGFALIWGARFYEAIKRK